MVPGPTGLISADAAARFLSIYSHVLEASPVPLAVFTLPDAKTYAARDIAALAEYGARRAAAQVNVYSHINVHSLPEGLHRAHRGSKENVVAAVGLWVDIDARGPGRHKPPETLCPTAEHALHLVDEFNRSYWPLRTSLTIHSGHGAYAAILFREPLLVEDPVSLLRLEELSHRYRLLFHRIAEKYGWTGAVEYCDAAKVLRLPGTVNRKDRKNPKPVRLVDENAARFDPVELDELLPPLPKSAWHTGTPAILSAEGTGIVLRTDAHINHEVIDALCELHPRFGDTWNHRRNDLTDNSCSGYDLALASMAVALGMTDQQITDLLVVHRREFPGKRQDRRGNVYLNYLTKLIRLAREGRISSEAAAAEWDQFHAALRGDTATPGDPQPEHPAAGDHDREHSS
jgi:hypothetical protein